MSLGDAIGASQRDRVLNGRPTKQDSNGDVVNSRGPEPDFGSIFRRSIVEADDFVVTSVGIDDRNPLICI